MKSTINEIDQTCIHLGPADRIHTPGKSWMAFGMGLIVWFLCAVWITEANAAPGQPESLARQPSILIFGDSLSASYGIQQEQGWVSLLQKRLDILDKPHRVINASVSGETTDGGLRRLSDALTRVQPDLVILELGGNDGLRGFPLQVIEQNLSRMVLAIRQANADVLLVGMRIPPNYGSRYTEGFHRLYQRIAEDKAVPLVPFMLDQIALKPELMQDDRIHPRAEAQEQILENIWPQLEPLL